MEDAAWQGGIAAIFTLAADEVTTYQLPRPYCMVLPRQSLLPFVTEGVHSHFKPHGPPMGSEIWFEANGEPLRWQIPIGVLFDLLNAADAVTLPWRITVHLQAFPADAVLRSTRQEAESVLLNALKESCVLRCGSAMPAMTLSPSSQQALGDALAAPRSDLSAARAGCAAIGELIENAVRTQLAGQATDGDVGATPPSRAVPLRVFTSATAWRQQPLPPLQPDGQPSLLRDALALLLPAHFDAAGSEASGGVGGGRSAPLVIVQGVVVPLNTPLQWLWESCHHPDGWLYVTVRVS